MSEEDIELEVLENKPIKAKKPIRQAHPSLTSRERKFAALVASGTAQGTAYTMVGYKATTDLSKRSNASKLAAKPILKAYIQTLREKEWEAQALTLAEKRAFLASAVRTPIDQITPDSPLAQEYTTTSSESGEQTKIKAVSKLQAIELDSKLAGDFYADRQDQRQNPFGGIVIFGGTNSIVTLSE